MESFRKITILLGITVFLSVFSVRSQEREELDPARFSYRSFSISPAGFYAGGNGGFAFSADVSFDYGRDIFSLGFGAGSELSIMGSGDDYTEVNILYGRSFRVAEKIFTDVFIGAGYFYFNTYGVIDSHSGRRGEIKESTIGFPIGAKLQFMLGPRYSMGVKLGTNINSLESIGTIGLVLQWNRKRKEK